FGKTAAASTATETPRGRVTAPAPTTAASDVIHTDVYFDFKSTRLRADTVRQFLVELGVPENSVKVVTIGPEGALCDEPSKECQQLNRRVHLEIRKMTRAAAVPVRPDLAVGDVLRTSDR